MKIGICLNREDFFYDVHSLVKSFFQDDEVSIFTDGDEAKKSVPWNLLFSVDIPDYEDRKAAKNALKKELYSCLAAYTGRDLPWGNLSGIRPTRLPMGMLDLGKADDEILVFLENEHLVSDKKARLALEIAKTEREILKGLNLSEGTYSLYVNIPFCPSICLYCTFSSSPVSVWRKRIPDYLSALRKEMLSAADSLSNLKPLTAYIGGGTPTSLTAEELDELLSMLHGIWDLEGCREFTVEAGRPDSISPEKLSVLRKHGAGRISVNPQTMNDETLRFIGRQHTAEDTVRAFSMAREAGFENINMDIILGLPGEGEREVMRTLDGIRKLGPDSLTVHSLAVKRASRLRREILDDRFLDAEADRGSFGGRIFENSDKIMQLASDCAADMGMRPYYMYRQKNMKGNLENTGFSVPGKECLYNIIIMEEVQTIRAFGAGASTKYVWPDGRIERTVNPKDVKTWLDRTL